MTHISINTKGATANPSNKEGLLKQFANGSRELRPEPAIRHANLQQLWSTKMETSMEKHRNFFKDESGSAAMEYRLLVAMIAMVIIAGSVTILCKTLSIFF